MGAQWVRRLLLAAAAGALLASGAGASYYYESYWTYADFNVFRPAGEPKIVGNEQYLYITFFEFIDEGSIFLATWFTKEGEYVTVDEVCYVPGAYECTARGFTPYGSRFLAALDYSGTKEGSVLVLEGGWEVWSENRGDFRALAAVPNSPDYYCYRFYDGAMRVCRSPGTPEVSSYFTPPGSVRDMAAGAEGCLYVALDESVLKYDPAGTLVNSWRVPGWLLKDLTVDAAGRLLALTEDNYAYVYDSGGLLLSSFTGPYVDFVQSAGIGPDDKYYVLCCNPYSAQAIWVYRFAPSPTNIVPASLGRIKAVFN